ncbi:MAG: nickel pincer cofactor biosynthesis protein LarC [Acidobacteriota bacterium]
MSRLLYFDCFSGISGDMLLGALLDAGLPLDALKAALGTLAVGGYDISASRVLRAGVSATRFIVDEHGAAPAIQHDAAGSGHTAHATGPAAPGRDNPAPAAQHQHHHHADPHRSLPEIFTLIDRSALSEAGRARAQGLFQRLAVAEAAIHQMPVDQVHLHEVGAIDSIIDIVGAVFALEWFGADAIVCSPLNVGGGMVHSAHGVFPVPAPATVSLLGDAPIYAGQVQHELVTPTGALIVSDYATSYGPIPAMSIDRVGYGAGQRDFPSTPNVLRILVGRAAAEGETDRVTVIECEIDDMNPQIFGVAMERLYTAGALEVFYVPIQMKKNRPGILLTVVAPPVLRPAIADVVFRETTTIGLRHYEVDRECLRREMVTVETAVGPVRFKVAYRHGQVVNAAPEFEDCVEIAASASLSVKEVQALAVQAFKTGRS